MSGQKWHSLFCTFYKGAGTKDNPEQWSARVPAYTAWDHWGKEDASDVEDARYHGPSPSTSPSYKEGEFQDDNSISSH